jgi:hypothetical protein
MSTLRANTLKPITSGNSLVLQGDSGGSGVSGPSIDSNGDVDFTQNTNAKIKLPSGGGIYESDGSTEILTESSGTVTLKNTALDSSVITGVTATQSEVFGTHTTGSITASTTALTVASASGISNGDFVVGEGITPGTTVSSGGGTTSITLSANATEDLSSAPLMFYSATKLLSPGLVGGMLCRAWVNFDGSGTVAIRASNNVSSITDNGTGDYTVNLTTAMPDAKYCCIIAGYHFSSGSSTAGGDIINAVPTNSSSARILNILASSDAYRDLAQISFSIFR